MEVECGWVIEDDRQAGGATPRYFALMPSGHRYWSWTNDHGEALRFARRKDGLAVVRHFEGSIRSSGCPAVVVNFHEWECEE